MITHEMMQATVQEQEGRIAQFQAEQEASRSQDGITALSRRPTSGWLRLPSFVANALRPASAQ